ncbi:MAG: type II secretion system protein J [Phycisphaerales bacterium]
MSMHNTNRTTQAGPSTRGARSAFTIIEIMVTIGILVLIAAGMSTIFSSVSQTVNGGKRIAELNRYAAQFERVMRRDFENMSRDGFLVIVQQNAPGFDPVGSRRDVQLSPADSTDLDDSGDPGRLRRVDEIMFFANGQFETSRRAISPDLIARSSQAAIYYGHGQKRRPDLLNAFDDPSDDNNLFFNPVTYDNNIRYNASASINQAGLGTFSTDGQLNPNQYASDWALLRHVTLLVNPQTSGQDLPDELFGFERLGNDRQFLEDSERQIALQPAGRSIFNSLSQTGFDTLPDPTGTFVVPKWFGDRQLSTGGGPTLAGYTPPMLRASGLVDIVTGDLASIRTTLYGLSNSSDANFDNPMDFWSRSNPNQIAPAPMDLSYDEFSSVFWESTTAPNPSDASTFTLPTTAPVSAEFQNVRSWMIDALPSLWDLTDPLNPIQLSRVRYEDVPTRLIYDQDAFTGLGSEDNQQRLRTYSEANQEMLGSSVFVPRCTEFIVEWSFGFIDPTITNFADPNYKRIRWHGLERWVDANQDGIIDTSVSGISEDEDQLVAFNYDQRGGTAGTNDPLAELILGHGPVNTPFPAPNQVEIATFGQDDLTGNEWRWPKFIRITMSIADPNDNTIEQTYQMVFDVPSAN